MTKNKSCGSPRDEEPHKVVPTLRPPPPGRWSPKRKSNAEKYLRDQINRRMRGLRLDHQFVVGELHTVVEREAPASYKPSERLVFNYTRRASRCKKV